MSNSQEGIVYSKNVVEIVTLAKEYTAFLERTSEFEASDFLSHAQKLLPLIYLKGCLLPDVEATQESEIEKFVSETDWTFIRNGIAELLGSKDDFFEITEKQMFDTEGGEQLSISELMADIYQDMKDFIELYRFGKEESITEAIHELKQTFAEYWGYKATVALKAIHKAIYADDDAFDDNNTQANDENNFYNRFYNSRSNQD